MIKIKNFKNSVKCFKKHHNPDGFSILKWATFTDAITSKNTIGHYNRISIFIKKIQKVYLLLRNMRNKRSTRPAVERFKPYPNLHKICTKIPKMIRHWSKLPKWKYFLAPSGAQEEAISVRLSACPFGDIFSRALNPSDFYLRSVLQPRSIKLAPLFQGF